MQLLEMASTIIVGKGVHLLPVHAPLWIRPRLCLLCMHEPIPLNASSPYETANQSARMHTM